MERGFEVIHDAVEDPRAAVLAAVSQVTGWTEVEDMGSTQRTKASPRTLVAWFKTVVVSTSECLPLVIDAPLLHCALSQLVNMRFSNSILIPEYYIVELLTSYLCYYYLTLSWIILKFLGHVNTKKCWAKVLGRIRQACRRGGEIFRAYPSRTPFFLQHHVLSRLTHLVSENQSSPIILETFSVRA